jgi:hypothetical protein
MKAEDQRERGPEEAKDREAAEGQEVEAEAAEAEVEVEVTDERMVKVAKKVSAKVMNEEEETAEKEVAEEEMVKTVTTKSTGATTEANAMVIETVAIEETVTTVHPPEETEVAEEPEEKATDRATAATGTLTTARLLVEDHMTTVMRELSVTTEAMAKIMEAEEMAVEMMEKEEELVIAETMEMVQETTTELVREEVQETTAETSEDQRTKEMTPTMTENDQEEVMVPHVEKEDLQSATTASKKVISPETAINQEKRELKELETVVAREEETTTEVEVPEVEPELKVATTKLQESEMHEPV